MRTTNTSALAAAALLWIAPGSAAADDETNEDAGTLHIGLQAGLVLPQLQSEFGTAAGVELDVGYRVTDNLAPFLAVGYAQPRVDSELSDPRLVAGGYSTATRQRDLTVSAGALWRFMEPNASFNAYAGLAARVWMLETLTNGEAGGAGFQQNEETSTRYGAALLGGAEYRVGPGAALLELDVGGSDLPHLITGDVATTSVSLFAGYRLLLM